MAKPGVDVEAVHAATARGRRAAADLIESLDEAQLDAPSLCTEWPVRVVAGHLAAGATMPSTPRLLFELVKARGDITAMIDRSSRESARRPVAELVSDLREHAGHRASPPGVGPRGPMTDALVHTGDIAVPLGLPHEPDPADVRLALDFVAGARPTAFVAKGRLDGLRLVADDAGFADGEGTEVRGRGIDVLMAACGRPAVLDRLTGDGVAVLRSRIG
ncbi:maleylpyruvate isomerase family mycothiol-dependent enzyme [Pseudonocardia nematodicida]|uniref:Maleylpyruvate isomerase family mycothiol-dependent enzyme n=1 Tax=Pseudonocardia nematodicida TaxID=1206997 RepID=A0ABV1K6K6_9PSEU